ncbi:MAG: lytic transglycosylase domain-containing protein [Candidatus Sericytochromatia bacterium]
MNKAFLPLLCSALLFSACDLEMPSLVNASLPGRSSLNSASSLHLPARRLSQSESVKLARSQAARFSVDTNLVLGVMTQESGFNANAVSPVGAMGMMQLMPSTVQHINSVSPVRVSSAFNPTQNVAAGTWYLRSLYNQLKDYPEAERWKFALASYNGGIGRVSKAIAKVSASTGKPRQQVTWLDIRSQMPRETQNYVPAVLAHRNYYQQHLAR